MCFCRGCPLQWLDFVVPHSQIEFCRRSDGQLMRLGGGARWAGWARLWA
jgi:hypothetical protein